MKPAYLTELLRNEIVRHWLGYDPQRSCENFFEQVAAEEGKPVYGLDDVGETMYMLFDREPFHWQCEELKKIVEYPEREVTLERSIKASYRMGYLSDIALPSRVRTTNHPYPTPITKSLLRATSNGLNVCAHT